MDEHYFALYAKLHLPEQFDTKLSDLDCTENYFKSIKKSRIYADKQFWNIQNKLQIFTPFHLGYPFNNHMINRGKSFEGFANLWRTQNEDLKIIANRSLATFGKFIINIFPKVNAFIIKIKCSCDMIHSRENVYKLELDTCEKLFETSDTYMLFIFGFALKAFNNIFHNCSTWNNRIMNFNGRPQSYEYIFNYQRAKFADEKCERKYADTINENFEKWYRVEQELQYKQFAEEYIREERKRAEHKREERKREEYESSSESNNNVFNEKAKTKSDPYIIFGIRYSATKVEIRKRYIVLCLKFHPDKAKTKEQELTYTELMQSINNAYECIK
jgi:hypothetical protein